jgi:NAD(P)-dependent dehydrogenase (short-subunit alcohol dehydrogenase family)
MSILITGAGRGIGAATARRMAHVTRVIVADLEPQRARDVAADIVASGGDAVSHQLDVTDAAAVADVVRQESRVEPVSMLFCNAGVNIRKRTEEISLAEWRRMMDVHVKGAFLCARAVLPDMCARRSGVILTMSSDYAVLGMPAAPAYAAAKTAVYSLTKSLALEFASFGIRVNALGPGPIDTELLRSGRTGEQWAAAERKLVDGIAMKRLGRPEEVAALAAFLLSDRASYISGQIVHPNGGQMTW